MQRQKLSEAIQNGVPAEFTADFATREEFDKFQKYALSRIGMSYLKFFLDFHQFSNKVRLVDGGKIKGFYFDQAGYMRLI
jgi:hypothetical protein